MSDLLDIGPLKGDARAGYPPSHPYRLAVEALPDSVPRQAFLAQLRILLPLSRIREDG
ncbi:MAG: hypothetical protein L3K05_05465 [Thermoplasmata archaeon]|nr:hypothetical protein [Thermoplasmata archaeon]